MYTSARLYSSTRSTCNGRKKTCLDATDGEIEVSEAIEEDSVTIHGIVPELSPIKTGKRNAHVKYFTGQLSDGKKCMRLVSFNPKLRSRLNESFGDSSAVAIKECRVKRASVGDDLEIVASARRSTVESSTREFELPPDQKKADICKEVSIEDIEDLAVMQVVTVYMKVLFIGEPENIQQKNTWRTLKKQECVVGDISGTIRIVLWEGQIGVLQVDCSYKIIDVTVRIYRGDKYLPASPNCQISEIEDIGDTIEVESDEELPNAAKFVNGYIQAVVSCEHYASCVNCSAKLPGVLRLMSTI